jgi:hypothetical protein
MLRKPTPPPLVIPRPPVEALKECSIPRLQCGTAQCVESNLIERGVEIAACNARRRALIDAWPKQPEPK